MFQSTWDKIMGEVYNISIEKAKLYSHNHKIFTIYNYYGNCNKKIDEMVSYLQNLVELHEGKIKILIEQINNINKIYRKELCGKCCHISMCNLTTNIQYGSQCEKRNCAEISKINI